MQKQPSLYSSTLPNAVTGETLQLRWGVSRCHECHCIFTVMALSNDIPVSLKCMSCDTFKLYTAKEAEAIQKGG